jgi:hypothetical protein
VQCLSATERVIVCGCNACRALFTIQLGAFGRTPIQDGISDTSTDVG